MADTGARLCADARLKPASGAFRERGSHLSADVRLTLPQAAKQVSWVLIGCKIYFCQDEDVCLFEEVYFKVPVDSKASANAEEVGAINVSYALSPKAPTVDFPTF